jgi:nucleotide-binding universal stress UspA family protein
LTKPVQNSIQRILVTLDNTQRGGIALEAAAQLAVELRAELRGLFVEDENLLRLACLPFACEIGGATAALRPLSSEVLERTLRAKADEAKKTLAAIAQRVQVQWSFQIKRGQFPQVTFAAAEEADVTIVGQEMARGATQRPAWCRPLRRPQARAPRTPEPIVVVMDGSAAACRALRIAMNLSRSTACELQVLLVQSTSHDFNMLREIVQAIAAEQSYTSMPRIEAVASLGDLLARFTAHRFCLAFLNRDNVFAEEPHLRELLDVLEGPLALVR